MNLFLQMMTASPLSSTHLTRIFFKIFNACSCLYNKYLFEPSLSIIFPHNYTSAVLSMHNYHRKTNSHGLQDLYFSISYTRDHMKHTQEARWPHACSYNLIYYLFSYCILGEKRRIYKKQFLNLLFIFQDGFWNRLYFNSINNGCVVNLATGDNILLLILCILKCIHFFSNNAVTTS